MKNKSKREKVLAAVAPTVEKILHRITRQTITAAIKDSAPVATNSAPVQILPSVVVEIGGKNVSENFNNVYGILPFAMKASQEELMAVAKQLEQAKYMLTERGDYYGAWRANHRQRIILSVLTGMTTFSLNRV